MRRVVAAAIASFLVLAAPAPSPADDVQAERIKDLKRQLAGAEAERDLALIKLKKLKAEIAEIGPRYQEARYKALVDKISTETARLRALPLKTPIVSNVIDKKGLHDLLDRLLAQELKPEALAGTTFFMEKLDLLKPGQDLRAAYGGLLEGQVGGLYNDRDKSLYVVSVFDPTSLLGRVILAHEICHALQDQNFDIGKLPVRTKNDDQNLAASAVLEGDATLLMVEWGGDNFAASNLLELTKAMKQGTEGIDTAPPALVQTLIFPYIEGLQFLMKLQADGSANWRNRPFEHPPASTEQILHPEKYWPNPEAPVDVTLPAWDKAGMHEIYRGTQGEFGTRLILTPPAAFPKLNALSLDVEARDPVATAGAAGWGGDLLVGYASGDGKQWGIAWKLAWDTPGDAQEFESALRRRVALWPGFADAAEALKVPADRGPWNGAGNAVSIRTSGTETLVLLGDGIARLEELGRVYH